MNQLIYDFLTVEFRKIHFKREQEKGVLPLVEVLGNVTLNVKRFRLMINFSLRSFTYLPRYGPQFATLNLRRMNNLSAMNLEYNVTCPT